MRLVMAAGRSGSCASSRNPSSLIAHPGPGACLPACPACLPACSVHGNALKWLVWVEDSDNEHIYHSGGQRRPGSRMRQRSHQGSALTHPAFCLPRHARWPQHHWAARCGAAMDGPGGGSGQEGCGGAHAPMWWCTCAHMLLLSARAAPPSPPSAEPRRDVDPDQEDDAGGRAARGLHCAHLRAAAQPVLRPRGVRLGAGTQEVLCAPGVLGICACMGACMVAWPSWNRGKVLVRAQGRQGGRWGAEQPACLAPPPSSPVLRNCSGWAPSRCWP